MDLVVDVGAPIEVGKSSQGLRRMVPILSGRVNAGGKQGRVLPGGADYQRIVGGEVAHLDARYVLEFEDGARIYVHNTALRVASSDVTAKLLRGEPVPPEAVYFRCQPQFETQAPAWQWLERFQFVGTGRREPSAVIMRFFVVR